MILSTIKLDSKNTWLYIFFFFSHRPTWYIEMHNIIFTQYVYSLVAWWEKYQWVVSLSFGNGFKIYEIYGILYVQPNRIK